MSAGVTRALAARFNAPALLTRYTRLLIDPNRGADDPTLVMQLSDGAVIPGNARVDAAEIARRIALYWSPYRQAGAALLDQMSAAGPAPAIVSLHSFTPVWRGSPRPWRIGLLWDNDPRLAQPLLEELEAAGLGPVGDNEPYDGALKGDTLYELASARGLPHVLIELRQDLIAVRIASNKTGGINERGPARCAIPSASVRASRSGSICRRRSPASKLRILALSVRKFSAWLGRWACFIAIAAVSKTAKSSVVSSVKV